MLRIPYTNHLIKPQPGKKKNDILTINQHGNCFDKRKHLITSQVGYLSQAFGRDPFKKKKLLLQKKRANGHHTQLCTIFSLFLYANIITIAFIYCIIYLVISTVYFVLTPEACGRKIKQAYYLVGIQTHDPPKNILNTEHAQSRFRTALRFI